MFLSQSSEWRNVIHPASGIKRFGKNPNPWRILTVFAQDSGV